MQDAQHIDKEDEFHIFRQSVAVQVSKLPLNQVSSCQNKLQGMLTRYSLANATKKQNTTSALTLSYPSFIYWALSCNSRVSAYF